MKPLFRAVLAFAFGAVVVGLPVAAAAAEEGAREPSLRHMVSILVGVVLAGVFAVGVGCALAVLRVILPGLARSADRSLATLRTGRLFLSGLLPLLGALLLSWAIVHASIPPAVILVVWLPLLLLGVAGAMAALPHLGERVLREGAQASLLRRCAVGGVVAGLAMVTWILQPVGLLVSLLLGAWVLGVGLGLLGRPTRPAPPPEA